MEVEGCLFFSSVASKIQKETIISLHPPKIIPAFKAINIAEIFMKEIFHIHGIQKTIITDRDAKFTSNLCKWLFAGLGIQINLNTTYHAQKCG